MVCRLSPLSLSTYWDPHPQWNSPGCLFGTRLSMILCLFASHFGVSYYMHLWVCVCVVLNCWMLSLPVAERVQLRSPPFALWLLSADSFHQHCGSYGLERWPGRQVEEQSRICTHKSDRYMACHYFPLTIILLLLFILWATLAVFAAWLRNICGVALWGDRCSWLVVLLRLVLWQLALALCKAQVCVVNLLCWCISMCMCVFVCVFFKLDCFVFTHSSYTQTFSWNNWTISHW